MKSIDKDKIKDFYNNIPNVWGNDIWHQYSKLVIIKYINKCDFWKNSYVLNAGSGGNDYGIICKDMCHVDIAEDKIMCFDNHTVSSIEQLPFDNTLFDNILCVGSVINYCDAMQTISEFSRIIKTSGRLILEFESSWGFEYTNHEVYKKDASIASVEYMHEFQNQWLYSPNYIRKILVEYKFKIIDTCLFHILSGLSLKFLGEKTSVNLTGKTDRFIKYMPFFKNHANNVLYLCVKS